MKSIRTTQLKATCLALLTATAFGAHANLIVDGDFEQPVTGPGGFNSGYTAFGSGATFGGAWLVIGSGNNVAVTPSSEYTSIGGPLIYFVSHGGAQSLDLTGEFDNGAAVGVQQNIPTLAGQTYSLSFWVGAVNTPDWGPYAGSATINVLLNGSPFQTAINSDPSGDATTWKQFTYLFTATGPTTLAFQNGSPPRGENGLDDVVVELVPEPTALSLIPLALLAVCSRRIRTQ
jgi:hypothetical protein